MMTFSLSVSSVTQEILLVALNLQTEDGGPSCGHKEKLQLGGATVLKKKKQE